jgi:ketosteroid isomerase-like protein
MSTEENKRIALAYFAERSAGNPEAFARLDDSATWWVMAKSPMGGKKTKAELMEIISQNADRMEIPIRLTVTGVTAEGDRVAIEAEGYAKLKDGKTYENLYHFLFIIKDGKIQLAKEYCDTLYADEIFNN